MPESDRFQKRIENFKKDWYRRCEEIRKSALSNDAAYSILFEFDFEKRNILLITPKHDLENEIDYFSEVCSTISEVTYSVAIAQSNFKLKHKGFWAQFLGAFSRKSLEETIKNMFPKQ